MMMMAGSWWPDSCAPDSTPVIKRTHTDRRKEGAGGCQRSTIDGNDRSIVPAHRLLQLSSRDVTARFYSIR